TALATSFDPGAFAVQWGGSLNFNLDSEGRLTEQGPQASLQLANLNGELRGRKLSGAADLVVTPQPVLAGTLSLKSGGSELRFRGERGDAMNATLALNIASLNDWLPDSSGELNGQFAVRGNWPELAIEGEASGSELHAFDVRLDSLELNIEVDNPRDPSGAARVDLTNLAVAGFEFETLHARASGTPDAHQLELSATGDPLGTDLALRGARTQDGWSGSLERLLLDVQDAARLTLREPVQIVYGKNALDVSEACLAEGDIQLCVQGSMQPDGAMQANYSMSAVPLALGNVLAPADLPVQLAGIIEGRGNVRRTPEGTLFGEAQINSPSGRISRPPIEGAEDEDSTVETLFSYEDLRIAANLSGPQAQASLNARLQDNGSLSGEVALQGLGEPATGVTGTFSADIPDLAPFAVFAPQLANVQGRAEARARVAGTLQQPDITAELNATEQAADIPASGLRLKNGRVQAKPTKQGEIAVSGAIESGGGRL
ncbi:MAG: translocation/assembly module TamB domain-containing protein, partial [Burkholderiaceae bacterium]